MNRANQRRDMDGEMVTGIEIERRKGVVDRGDSVTSFGDMEQLYTWLIAECITVASRDGGMGGQQRAGPARWQALQAVHPHQSLFLVPITLHH